MGLSSVTFSKATITTMSARWNNKVPSGTSWIALSENANKLNHYLQLNATGQKRRSITLAQNTVKHGLAGLRVAIA
jgi:hypothetical protein